MFGFLKTTTRKSQKTSRAPRFARLGLEDLEGRDNPSTLTLSVDYGSGKNVTLSGTLSDHSNPSYKQINITGQASGSTWTNSQGQFSVTLTASALGDVSATANDGTSNTPTVTLTDAFISLTFVATEYPGHMYTLAGTVSYDGRVTQGLVVHFGGAPQSLWNSQTVVTTCSNTYFMGALLNGTATDNGSAAAWVVTPWGTESEWARDAIYQSGT